MVKRTVLALIIAASTFTNLLGGQYVSAASAYDNVFHSTDALTLQYGSCTLDVTSTWKNYLGSYASSFQTAVENGTWGISQFPRYVVDSNNNVIEKALQVYWSESQTMNATFVGGGWKYIQASPSSYSIAIEANDCVGGSLVVSRYSSNPGILSSEDQSVVNYFYNGTVTYPSGYEGDLVNESSGYEDSDGDGLIAGYESAQGTSDTNEDSDGDGINDYKESIYFSGRDNVYCDTSASPKVCAYPDPLNKDVYVEIDWMDDSSRDFKPTSTQLSLISGGLDDLGYDVHLDVGQYGGGNEISNYVEELPFAPEGTTTDFFDLKDGNAGSNISANFDSARKGVWRYMISGYSFAESPTSSGASFAGSENIFISYGLIEDNQSGFGYSSLDTAIAGTAIHETGHSLCLSDSQSYSYQSSACQFSGVDTASSSTYDSVMNYNLQMFQTRLSDGDNGTGDHDDWSAIDGGGISDFTQWTISELGSGVGQLHHGLSIKQARQAEKAGTLGKLRKNHKVYDLKNNTVYDLKTKKLSKLE